MRTTFVILIATLLTAGFVGTLAGAGAHACAGQDPATTCGTCADGLPHSHKDLNGNVYCESSIGLNVCFKICARVTIGP